MCTNSSTDAPVLHAPTGGTKTISGGAARAVLKWLHAAAAGADAASAGDAGAASPAARTAPPGTRPMSSRWWQNARRHRRTGSAPGATEGAAPGMMNGSASRERPLAGGALQRLGGALMLPARRHSTVRARRNTLRLCACVLLSLFVLYHNRFLFFSNGSMGNRHDWYTLARQRHTLRVLGATLMDSDAARLRSDFGASAAPPEGFNAHKHAWAVTIGTATYDKRAVQATLASIAAHSVVRNVIVMYADDIPRERVEAMLTPELRRCLQLELVAADPLACPNADAWHTWRYHGTYMRFNLWGLTHFERIVYVDLDFIVLDRRFDNLFWYRMPKDALIGAAPYSSGLCYSGDAPTTFSLGRPWCPLASAMDDGLFNAGMMVLTPDEATAQGLLAMHARTQLEARNWLTGRRFCVTSQPVLQHYFVWLKRGAVDYLPVAFNFWPKAGAHLPDTRFGAHFVGEKKFKPWALDRRQALDTSTSHAEWWGDLDRAGQSGQACAANESAAALGFRPLHVAQPSRPDGH